MNETGFMGLRIDSQSVFLNDAYSFWHASDFNRVKGALTSSIMHLDAASWQWR